MKHAIAAFFLALPIFAHAEQPYLGVDYGYIEVKSDQFETVKLGNVGLRFGSNLTRYLGAEAHFTTSIDDGSFNYIDTTTATKKTAKVSNSGTFAVFLKPYLYLDRSFEVYALLGASHLKYERDIDKAAYDGNSASGGVGVNFHVNPNVSLGIDYVQYEKDIAGANVGIRYHFN